MAKPSALESLIRSRFDVDPLTCEAMTAIWAAEILADEIGDTKAVKQLCRLNAKREKQGRYTEYPGFRTKLWDASARIKI